MTDGGGSSGCSTCVGIFKTLSRSRPVCLLVTIASPASTVERIEMQFGMWTRGAQETVFRCWCKLAPPSEYDCMIHAFRRCVLMSICLAWFDFLLHLFRFCACFRLKIRKIQMIICSTSRLFYCQRRSSDECKLLSPGSVPRWRP